MGNQYSRAASKYCKKEMLIPSSLGSFGGQGYVLIWSVFPEGLELLDSA
jgi:hypothetical protein